MFKINCNEIGGDGGSRGNKIVKNSSKLKVSKNEKSENLTYIGAIEESIFLNSNIKKVFNYLQKKFIEVLIL